MTKRSFKALRYAAQWELVDDTPPHNPPPQRPDPPALQNMIDQWMAIVNDDSPFPVTRHRIK